MDFTKTDSFDCYYPNAFDINSVFLNNFLDTQLTGMNHDDNFFCYPFISFRRVQPQDCIKEKLDLFSIDSNDFFIPKQFGKSTFIWDDYYNRCFYYDGFEINSNKIFYYGNLRYMYSYHSNDLSCNSNNCINNTIIPGTNGFSCSLTSSLSNLNLNKIIVRQPRPSINPSIPTQVAPAGSAHWNGNYCFYSSGNDNIFFSVYHSLSYFNSFSYSANVYFNGAIDVNCDKLYTYYSNLCNKKTCTTDNLKNLTITNNNFVCPQAEDTQLASNEKNTLWKNGYCFYKPTNFTSDSSFACHYPNSNYFSSIALNNPSNKQLINENNDDNFFCYLFFSNRVQPEDCIKEKLDLFSIDSNDFFIPKQFGELTFIWDDYYNRCFYYDGFEINSNKVFYYGNLPYMYSYHSNDVSCNTNSCNKTGIFSNPTKNQFKCTNTTPTPPTPPTPTPPTPPTPPTTPPTKPPTIPNYGITTYYPVDFAMIKEFFNTIGSLFKIPSMDTLHWAIYYPLMVILYPLSPWITIFWEPWINLANSIQLFMLYKNT